MHVKTNSAGIYNFASLQTGTYHLEIKETGFRTAQLDSTLAVGQTAQADVALSVGDTTETVEVQADEQTSLHTESSTLSTVIGARQVSDLPLNGRNPYALAALTPGITPGGSFGAGLATARGAVVTAATNNFEANGGIGGSNEILLDGVPITLCCQGQPALTPSVEVVNQFSVITSVPEAQFGRTSGGILNIVTKTGTNGFHGDVYEFFRNDALDAANFFTKRSGIYPIPTRHDYTLPHRFNQYGGFVGGPVFLPRLYDGRNKTFFTAGYEGTRNTTNSFVTTTVPTLLMRQGIFTEAPKPIYNPFSISGTTRTPLPAATVNGVTYAPGLAVGSINPVAANLLRFYPTPNAPGVTNNYSYANTLVDREDQYNFRLDHNFTQNQRTFIRGTRDVNNHHENDLLNQPNGPNATSQPLTAYLLAIDHSATLSPTALLQVYYGFGYQKNVQAPQNYIGFNAGDLGYSANFVSQQQLAGFPLIAVTGLATLGNSASRNSFVHYTHELGGSLVLQRGKQTLIGGYDGRLVLENEQSTSNPVGSFTFDTTLTNGPAVNTAVATGQGQFDAFAAFLLGTPTTASLTRQATVALSQYYHAVYVQDNWRIAPKLTLNLGARYDIETGFRERHNRWADVNTGLTNPYSTTSFPFTGGAQYLGINGNPNRTWQTSFNRVAPRVGFAYAPANGTVVRGGFGILNVPTSERIYSAGTLGFSQGNLASYTSVSVPSATAFSDPFSNGILLPAGPTGGVQAGTGAGATGLRYDNPQAYYEQWNFGVEQELVHGVVLHLNYAGSHGVKLPINVRFNDLPPQYYGTPGSQAQISYLQAAVPNPLLGKVSSGPLSTATVQRVQTLVPYPQYTTNTGLANTSLVQTSDDIGSASYNGLQAYVSVNPSRNLTAIGSYTWSKLIGNVVDITTGFLNVTSTPGIQSFYHLKDDERSVLATDIPQRFVGSLNYTLPFGRNQRFGSRVPGWANEIIGDWRLNSIDSVQSGYAPGLTQTGAQAYAGSRPSFTGTLNPLTQGSTHDRLGGGLSQPYYNPAAFRTSMAFELGNVPRSAAQLRGPLSFQDDLSAIKQFALHEQFRLEFRLEAFNVLNKVQFGLPNTQVNSATFGYITTQANLPRNVQAALKLFF